MVRVSTVIGLLLLVLGLVGYFATGRESPTALIPAVFGVLFLVIALIGRKGGKARMHAMHGGAVLALVGALGTARGLAGAIALLGGGEVDRPAAVIAQSIAFLLFLVFLVLAVQSFIAARRAKPEAEAGN